MVKITNGINTFEVPLGAYRGIFQKQGYNLIPEASGVSRPNSESSGKEIETEQDDTKLQELLEKPISQWNKREVKEFALVNDIDLAGTKSIDEAKARIKERIGL